MSCTITVSSAHRCASGGSCALIDGTLALFVNHEFFEGPPIVRGSQRGRLALAALLFGGMVGRRGRQRIRFAGGGGFVPLLLLQEIPQPLDFRQQTALIDDQLLHQIQQFLHGRLRLGRQQPPQLALHLLQDFHYLIEPHGLIIRTSQLPDMLALVRILFRGRFGVH
jgi:hypothetical protein